MTIELDEEMVWIPERLLRTQIVPDIKRHHPNETGGMLLGYVNGGHRVITALIDSGPNAQRGLYHMLPDDTYQQAKLLEHFEMTDGRESFLGEWHSHPESSPTMSPTDRRTLHRVTTKGRNLPALPAMVIVGVDIRADAYLLRAYRRRNSSRRIRLNERHFAEMSIRTYAP